VSQACRWGAAGPNPDRQLISVAFLSTFVAQDDHKIVTLAIIKNFRAIVSFARKAH
jgi:hypothetical protein